MEQILITGLDGSGKSAVLSAIEMSKVNGTFDIIRVPQMDAGDFKDSPELANAVLFVNRLNQMADHKNLPHFKAIALFSSMLLFRKLVDYKSKPTIKRLFLERHPLIDTGVYALFYADKMNTYRSQGKGLKDINKQYVKELKFIIDLIPENLLKNKTPELGCLISFIYQHFFVGEKKDIESLKDLFCIDLPEKIYYLKASPDILMHRLQGRKIYEAHESLSVLARLGMAYDSLFTDLKTRQHVMPEIIDVNSIKKLDHFKQFMESEYIR